MFQFSCNPQSKPGYQDWYKLHQRKQRFGTTGQDNYIFGSTATTAPVPQTQTPSTDLNWNRIKKYQEEHGCFVDFVKRMAQQNDALQRKQRDMERKDREITELRARVRELEAKQRLSHFNNNYHQLKLYKQEVDRAKEVNHRLQIKIKKLEKEKRTSSQLLNSKDREIRKLETFLQIEKKWGRQIKPTLRTSVKSLTRKRY